MSNFLDLKCPQCGDEDRLRIAGTTWLDVTEDGTDATNSDHEYEPGSVTYCGACNHSGILADFEPHEGDQFPLPFAIEGGRQ